MCQISMMVSYNSFFPVLSKSPSPTLSCSDLANVRSIKTDMSNVQSLYPFFSFSYHQDQRQAELLHMQKISPKQPNQSRPDLPTKAHATRTLALVVILIVLFSHIVALEDMSPRTGPRAPETRRSVCPGHIKLPAFRDGLQHRDRGAWHPDAGLVQTSGPSCGALAQDDLAPAEATVSAMLTGDGALPPLVAVVKDILAQAVEYGECSARGWVGGCGSRVGWALDVLRGALVLLMTE